MIIVKAYLITFYRFLASAFLFSFCLIIYSQEPLKVAKISGGINFDGIPDEQVWKKIQPVEMKMHKPTFGLEPTEVSTIKIAYDNIYFYVSGIFYYKDPSAIRAISKKRDYLKGSCDWFSVQLDSYNDKQNAWWFMTNPNGLRSDGAIKNDNADNSTDNNLTWSTFWDVKTEIKDSMWCSEFRIPFSSLRFQDQDGTTTMGIILLRSVASKTEVMTFPSIPQDYPTAYRKPSLSSEIIFEGLKPRNPVYFAPYVTAGVSQMKVINEAKTDYKTKSTPKFDAGFDAKYSITNNLTMDLTVNTDFAQVEADDQKINLTRYSLFFPEKRQFFMEKADVFDFTFLEGNNLFYSRRIGIYNGNPVRIYGGLRLTGRINKWDLGILDMQTAPYDDNPGENFGVFRTKRTLFNQNSYLGGMFTSKLGMNGAYNISYGIDGQFNIVKDEYLIFKLAQTFENDSIKKIFDLSPSKLFLQWQHRNQKGFGYDFLYTYSGERFNPGIGFELKDNYQGLRGILQYGWFSDKEASLMYQKISFTSSNVWNTITGLQETATGILTWHFEGKKGYSGDIYSAWYLEDITKTLSLGNKQATVPPGRYSFASLSAKYTTSTRNDLSGTFLAEAGSFYDGWKVSLSAAPTILIGTDFNFDLTYNLDLVNFPTRSVRFTNHIGGIRGLLTLSTKTSLLAFIQYNTSIDKVLTNIRFRYNPREGTDFYIVYDEGLNTNLFREVPTLPHSAGRTILFKYTYTFIF
jgi:hypothetical protein